MVIDTTGRPLRELHLAGNMGLLPQWPGRQMVGG